MPVASPPPSVMFAGAQRSAAAIAAAKAEAANTTWRSSRAPATAEQLERSRMVACVWIAISAANFFLQPYEDLKVLWAVLGLVWVVLAASAGHRLRLRRAGAETADAEMA